MAEGGGDATGRNGGGVTGVDIGAKGGVNKGGETTGNAVFLGGEDRDTNGAARGGCTTGSGCRGGSEVVDGESSGDRDNEGANDIVETYSWKNSLRVLLSRSSSSGWIS